MLGFVLSLTTFGCVKSMIRNNGGKSACSSQNSELDPSSPVRKRARVQSPPTQASDEEDVFDQVERLCGHTLQAVDRGKHPI